MFVGRSSFHDLVVENGMVFVLGNYFATLYIINSYDNLLCFEREPIDLLGGNITSGWRTGQDPVRYVDHKVRANVARITAHKIRQKWAAHYALR